MSYQKFQRKKEFQVHGHTRIGWGKLKGQPHSAFLEPTNKSYARWVVNQGDEFRYTNSRKWVLENLDVTKELTPSEWEYLISLERELTEEEEKSVEHFNDFLRRIDEITEGDENCSSEDEEHDIFCPI